MPDLLGNFQPKCLQSVYKGSAWIKDLLSDDRLIGTMSTDTFPYKNKTTNHRLTNLPIPLSTLVPNSWHKRDGTVGSASTVYYRLGRGSCQCLWIRSNILNARRVWANEFTAVGNLVTVIPTITILTFSTETDTELNTERGWPTSRTLVSNNPFNCSWANANRGIFSV